MLCSRCSKPIKPIVAVDIDGTLGDYHGHFVHFAQMYLGKKLPSARNYQSNRRFAEYLGISLPEYRTIKLAYRQGGMKRSMPIFPGALPLLRSIVESGCELWLTTTRPYLRLDNIDPDTRFWLERHAITYDGLLYDEDKYHTLAQTVERDRVILVIDDLTEQAKAAVQYFGPDQAVLYANEHNAWVGNVFRYSHRQLEQLVERKLGQWAQARSDTALA
jgi:hydroxymethylpyrimidine pyrophosphatase-like HAD family hydrolase